MHLATHSKPMMACQGSVDSRRPATTMFQFRLRMMLCLPYPADHRIPHHMEAPLVMDSHSSSNRKGRTTVTQEIQETRVMPVTPETPGTHATQDMVAEITIPVMRTLVRRPPCLL